MPVRFCGPAAVVGVLFGAFVASFLLAASCGGEGNDEVKNDKTLTSIAIAPSAATVQADSTTTFTAEPLDQYGDPIAVPITWTSSDTSVGTISSSGVFAALGAGETTVSASSGSVSGAAKVTVIAVGSNVIFVATDGSGDFNCALGRTDCEIEINRALATINDRGGGTVHVKTGIYIVNGSATIFSNTILEGDDWTTVIKMIDGFTDPPWVAHLGMLDIDGRTNVTIRNVKIDGNRLKKGVSRNDDWQGQPICFRSSSHLTIQNVNIFQGNCDTIDGDNGENIRIVNNEIEDIGHNAMRLSELADSEVRQNVVKGFAWNAAGPFFDYGKNIVIEGNIFAADYSSYGIFFDAWGSPGVENITIKDNLLSNHRGGGIVLRGSGDLRDVRILGNVIRGAVSDNEEAAGIKVVTGYQGVTINSNTIYGNRHGIDVSPSASNVIVRNNIITDNARIGIKGSNDIDFGYNNVWNNAEGDYGGCAEGGGDLHLDPLFADPTNNDFHLKSQTGRWDGKSWVTDPVTSPAIAAGDPTADNSQSPWGGIIEMGAYGNTAEASKGK